MKLQYLSLLVMAAVAAVSTAVAPVASAAPTPDCRNLVASTTAQCQTRGNVQINDSPRVQYAPQYPIDPFFDKVSVVQ